jgi:methylmalonyl-CoA mutase N-terminal domain/subunit
MSTLRPSSSSRSASRPPGNQGGVWLDPALEQSQVDSLRQVRASRSQASVAERLVALERAARGDGNLMPPILDAAEAYATVGEISDRLRVVFGEYREG